MISIALVGEDRGHFRVATRLVDDTLLERVDWLDGVLDVTREWRGLRPGDAWYQYDPADAYDLRPVQLGALTIPVSGHIGGRPLEPEAGMWRRVLALLVQAAPRPDVVVLVRDLDGHPERRRGAEQYGAISRGRSR